MFGKEWRWRRGDGYGFVRLVLDVHNDWKSIDGGKDKVGIGRRMVGGLDIYRASFRNRVP